MATTFPGALATAAHCWGFWDGFLVNDLGRLSADRRGLQVLVLLLLCAGLAYLAGAVCRRLRGEGPPVACIADRQTTEANGYIPASRQLFCPDTSR
jgi:hypothetical protein